MNRDRRSSWANGDLEMGHPNNPELDVTLSSTEFSMLQRLRQVGPGAHAVYVVKTAKGKGGLQSFRVQEHYIEVDTSAAGE